MASFSRAISRALARPIIASSISAPKYIAANPRLLSSLSRVQSTQTLLKAGPTAFLQTRFFTGDSNAAESEAQGKAIGWNIEPSSVVYIGNLFFDVKGDEVREFFASYGDVNNVKIVNDIRGFSKGFAFVTFADSESAKKAVDEAHGQLFAGRRLAVNFAAKRTTTAREPHEPSPTLFIGNLAYDVTDRELNNLFRPLKNIRDVRVAVDRRSGQPRGFAHADFLDIQSAVSARKRLENIEIRGRVLKLDFSHSSRNAAALAHASRTIDPENVDVGHSGEADASRTIDQENVGVGQAAKADSPAGESGERVQQTA